jgi:hypothetical protein
MDPGSLAMKGPRLGANLVLLKLCNLGALAILA